MIVQFVARSPKQVVAFLCEEAGVIHVGSINQTNVVRRWHDDVWENVHERDDLGEIWPVYTAELDDNCQDHITDFEDYQTLDENYLFVLSRSFCESCGYIPHIEISTKKTEYIIA